MDYKEDLRKKLPELKKIEGFPIGEDEDIINLSNPPFYTACPNPYIEEFLEKNGSKHDETNDDYHKKPYTDDINTNKNDRLTNAHSYHTKSPFHAIQQYIEHYTEPGDVVLDCFSGSGMTGIAAQKSNRKAILFDLSPIASFITHNYNSSTSSDKFLTKGGEILDDVKKELSWMTQTNHTDGNKGEIISILFSEHFLCPICKIDFDLWNSAIDEENKGLKSEFKCKNCDAKLTKNDCEKSMFKVFDPYINEDREVVNTSPVEIVYKVNNNRFKKKPDENDILLLKEINELKISDWFPTDLFMHLGEKFGDTWRSGVHKGLTNVHHFFNIRNLHVLARLFYKINLVEDKNIKNKLLITFNSLLLRSSKKAILAVGNYFNGGGGYITTISGNWYIPSLFFEVEVMEQFRNRLKKVNEINLHHFDSKNIITSCQSGTDFSNIPNNSIDYIFVDPPFGENLMYSELNFLNEAWFKITTNNNDEAIMNKSQNKSIIEYNFLMNSCFNNLFRVLKPQRWITIEYHNSKSAIWNGLQESLTKAGFVIAHTSVLKNKGGSFTINVSPNSVSNDLIINAYKPDKDFIEKFTTNAGEDAELDFTEMFLESLPVRAMIERTEKMLYSKMIGYYLSSGFEINYDSNYFYKMLNTNFIEQDGYWFTSNQINSYIEQKKKLKLDGLTNSKDGNLLLFVNDEKSSLLWLNSFLLQPKTFSDIHTAFNQLASIKDDQVPELLTLLEDNFIKENNVFRRPTSEEEHSNVNTKREKALLREFESLLLRAKSEKKKIKEVRKEALVFGFEVCYKNKRFKDILTLEKRLDKKIIENSSELNDFVEAAKIMVEGVN
jgi:DNA modification methylase